MEQSVTPTEGRGGDAHELSGVATKTMSGQYEVHSGTTKEGKERNMINSALNPERQFF